MPYRPKLDCLYHLEAPYGYGGMALCSNARRFSVDLARVRGVVEKQRVKEERVGWEGSLGGMAVVDSAALRSVGEEWQSNWELLEPF
jgi:hypothetical protein